ncbi:MAG: amino acid permease [Nitrospirota bacterium]|nr:amino acid permease [Nitrospirota bacterium]
MNEEPTLRQTLSLPYITFYGLATILGAGIYVLVGEIAGQAGLLAPVSFLIAAIAASFTAVSYAELSARIPRSAGEAAYVEDAFGRKGLTVLAGVLVVFVVITSSATLANGFAGYFRFFFPVPAWLIVTAAMVSMGLLAAWGIKESAVSAAILTLIEISGLIIIIYVSRDSLSTLPERLPEIFRDVGRDTSIGVFMGAFLAFFAFIGFEDMVNVAEEVKDPQRNMPLGIFLAFVTSTILYILVALTAVLSLPLPELIGNATPLATIYERSTGKSPVLITAISLFAVVNGVLVQVIVASRVLYGLSRQGHLPELFGRINERTKTPVFSTVFVVFITLVLALWLPLVTLAQIASFVVLIVYSLINLSLVIIKKRYPSPNGVKTYPGWIPVAGFVICAGIIIFRAVAVF